MRLVLKALNWFWKCLLCLNIFIFLSPIFLCLKMLFIVFGVINILMFYWESVYVFPNALVNIGQSSFSVSVGSCQNFQQNWSELRAKLVENRRKWSDFGGSHLRRGLKVLVWFYHIQKVSSVYEVYTQKIASLYPRFVTYHDFRTYWLF